MNLLPFFKAIEIDSSMKYSPSRAVRKSVSKYPDHFPVIVVFENIPRVNLQKPISNTHTIWNTNREGGWENYKRATDSHDAFENVIDTEVASNTEDMNKLNTKLTKVKFSSFGKVKIKDAKNDKELNLLYKCKSQNISNEERLNELNSNINKRLLEIRKEEFENEVEKVLMMKKCKGKSSAVFKTLRTVCGDKKTGQEQISMIDPKTNLLLFDPKLIKQASLKYCYDLLNIRVSNDDF